MIILNKIKVSHKYSPSLYKIENKPKICTIVLIIIIFLDIYIYTIL